MVKPYKVGDSVICDNLISIETRGKTKPIISKSSTTFLPANKHDPNNMANESATAVVTATTTPAPTPPPPPPTSTAAAVSAASTVLTTASSSTPSTSTQQFSATQVVITTQTSTHIPTLQPHINRKMAAAPPRLALLAPIAIQANPSPWPIVEPVFHFSGFEHQHYCPTHSQGPQPHEYIVFFHVNAGVSVTFQIGSNREVIRGPVTVPMVSQSGSPPIPMPVQVPPGHVMQQIVDENGTLRHVILSTAQHQQIHSQGSVQPHIHGHYINGVGQHFYSAVPSFAGPGPHFHTIPGGHLQPQTMHSQHSPSPPNTYHKDERSQRQHTKLLRKLEQQKQREMNSSALSTPAHSPSPRKAELNGIKRSARNGASSVGTSEDGEESSSVPDEDEDVASIIEQLSNVQLPQVSEITSRGALIQWTAPTSTENVVLNTRDLQYHVLLSDRGKEGKYKVIFKGKSLSCRIRDLRPGQEYYVCLQVYLEGLNGSPSEAAVFVTPSCEPDQPIPPKLLARSKNSLQLRWNAPNDNGAHIQQYVLECDDGKGEEFVEICKTRGKQFNLQKLQPSTEYTLRLAAINERGRSVYSDTVTYSTSGNPPSQPVAPLLKHATPSSLHLTWSRRSQDEEFILQINDKESGHGFLPAYTGRDVSYECQNLRRATSFQFRLKAENEAGQSSFSEEVTFRTLPERPGRPQKPQVKGKIHANHLKVRWDPPTDRGGAEINLYFVEISSGACFERIYTGPETETICDRLNPGTTYQVKVACESVGGTSQFSEPLTVTTEAVAPDAPSPPYCNSPPEPHTAILQWDKPDYNGGALVTEFEVELQHQTNTQFQQIIYKGKDTYCVATNLQPGEWYCARVRSINRIGFGPWSSDFEFAAGAAAPSAPITPTIIVRSATHLTVSWNEPKTNGAQITEYRLEYALNDQHECYNITYQGVQTSTEVRNLTPFTTYYFRVCANNVAGKSPYSDVACQKTLAAVPNAPTIDTYEEKATSVYLTWNEPQDNGSPITYYNIEYMDRLISTDSNVLEWYIEDLHPETTYRFKIQAVNGIGIGHFSNVLRITTKPLPPKPPKLECVGVGHNFLKLKWGDGRNTDFVRFYVEMYVARAREFQEVYTGTSYLCKVNKLQEQSEYRFRVCAETDHAGLGDYSDEYVFKTNAAVPSSIKAPRIAENAPSTAAAVAAAANASERNCITLEWQHSKNTFHDIVEYVLQWSKDKDQEFKVLYRGPETRYNVDNLEAGIDYTFRVCPVRLADCSDLFGANSPTLRYRIPSNSDANSTNSSTNNRSNSVDVVDAPTATRTVGLFKRNLHRITSICSNRSRPSNQEQAILLVIFFMITTVVVAAILQTWTRSNKE
ncbi:fibronectin type-III domain-containing protein 3A-like isoform X5 [Sitodiplosis mosellana]|uniref:fibronectin type-III domain-containing protein 3A-like isoform X5 n=1 Tax=Sitodiplosis mosellana TaxID=263140 RepID=UPI002444577A|nr:fibronectin type-III domain-containing protein 3A-like isoform X5 [Sitodiplosis mosellana]XP_055305315.1 fibronectin type-III domain-containing protein 3A-like isoform X5 [Sitodiplosis mosellana]